MKKEKTQKTDGRVEHFLQMERGKLSGGGRNVKRNYGLEVLENRATAKDLGETAHFKKGNIELTITGPKGFSRADVLKE